jgi:hypothetical protein
MAVRKSAVCAALVIAAGFLVASVGIGGAATPLPTLTATVVPKPVVKPAENVLGIVKLSYSEDASPTTLSNPYVRVEITPALVEASDFKPAPLSSSFCALEANSLSFVRCTLSNIKAGDQRTMFVVVEAPNASSISMKPDAFWNERVSGKNPVPNNTVSGDLDSTTVSTSANSDGKCTTGGSSLNTSLQFGTGNQVATQVTYSATTQALPCTPASVRDDVAFSLTNATCTASPCVGSEVTLPQLPANSPANVVVTFDGSLFPPPGSPPNPSTFVVYEIVSGTTGEAVPLCSSGEATSFGTCEVGAVKFGTRGIQVTLKVPGANVDPGYVG